MLRSFFFLVVGQKVWVKEISEGRSIGIFVNKPISVCNNPHGGTTGGCHSSLNGVVGRSSRDGQYRFHDQYAKSLSFGAYFFLLSIVIIMLLSSLEGLLPFANQPTTNNKIEIKEINNLSLCRPTDRPSALPWFMVLVHFTFKIQCHSTLPSWFDWHTSYFYALGVKNYRSLIAFATKKY